MRKNQMRRKSVLAAVLFLFLFTLAGCSFTKPETVVQKNFDELKKLNDEQISLYLDSNKVFAERAQSGTTDQENEAVKNLLKKFDYEIVSAETDGDTAKVKVKITNTDMNELIKDYYYAAFNYGMENADTLDVDNIDDSVYFELFNGLWEKDYATAVNEVEVTLNKESGKWQIQADDALADAILGGFVTKMEDSHFLSAEETVEMTFSSLKTIDKEVFERLMQIDEAMATSGIEGEAVKNLTEKIWTNFDYSITSSEENGEDAVVTVEITSVDMPGIITTFMTNTMTYATEHIGEDLSEETIEAEVTRILNEAILASEGSVTNSVAINVHNNGEMWEIDFNDQLIDAFLGGISGALDLAQSMSNQ